MINKLYYPTLLFKHNVHLNKFFSSINSLCKPAYLYFYISLVTVLLLTIRNIENDNKLFCGDNKECSSTLVFIMQILYIIFWTYVLGYICKLGYKTVSWVLIIIHCFMVAFIISKAFEINYKEIL